MTARKKTTEEFIAKARTVHGDKYDYSAAKYTGCKAKITITCPEGHTFEQRPDNHLAGGGCPVCYAATFYTTESFIAKARTVHGDKFDYSAVVCVGIKAKVTITCLKGHTFEQAPNEHLRGKGCLHCTGKTPYTTESFITKARKVHGDKFDYSAVVCVDSKTKITITCPEGHTFDQAPRDHLRGKGRCNQCAPQFFTFPKGKTPYTTESFIAKARTVHGDKYDYSAVNYVRSTDKVTITCPEGHTFEQAPSNHLKGWNCMQCSNQLPYTTESFIAKARTVHGDKYDYSAVVYTGALAKVTITCPEGHTYDQVAGNHLFGVGCRTCTAGGGYDTSKEGTIYYLRVTHEGAIRYKIGITNNSVQTRFTTGDLKMIDVLGLYTHGNGAIPPKKERFIKRQFKHAQYKGPKILASKGDTEIFNYDVLGLEDGGDLITTIQRIERNALRQPG